MEGGGGDKWRRNKARIKASRLSWSIKTENKTRERREEEGKKEIERCARENRATRRSRTQVRGQGETQPGMNARASGHPTGLTEGGFSEGHWDQKDRVIQKHDATEDQGERAQSGKRQPKTKRGPQRQMKRHR